MPQTAAEDRSPAAEERDAEALQAENASLQDRLLRAMAEAENTRRRADRAGEEGRQSAVADFARDLLPVADNLERALAAAERHPPQSDGERSLIEGIRATHRMLMAVLERLGIRKIPALGAPFDPMLHEAMAQVEDPSKPPGTVVQVMEDGYTIHDRLLRPARVIVAGHRPSE
jgi:molecular chaperone GrpE